MAKKKAAVGLIPAERIEKAILHLRGQKVMLDRDLATLYGVPTKVLNQTVRRNLDRFPEDFMFRLSKDEFENWRSQFVTSNLALRMGARYRPMAFTENGVAMLSSVLRSSRAIAVNLEIMRTLTRLRKLLEEHRDLRERLKQLEQKYDSQFAAVFDAIRKLLTTPANPQNEMGYHTLIDDQKS